MMGKLWLCKGHSVFNPKQHFAPSKDSDKTQLTPTVKPLSRNGNSIVLQL